MLRTRKRLLIGALVALAVGLAANALLGPLALGVIDYHYGESMTSQGLGLDAVALALVVPVALVAAWLIHRERLVGPVLAFIPGTFAAYMAPQYVIGPDYLGLPGNNEQFFLLHFHLFVLGIAVLLLAWQHVDRMHLVPDSPASDRRRTWILLGAAGFILLRWLPLLPGLVVGAPDDPVYVDNPTAFMLIALLDLAIVVPGTVTAAVGLWSGALWGRAAAYVAIGFYAVVPLSVAAMAIVMASNGDPMGSMGAALGFSAVALLSTLGAVVLYHPLGIDRQAVVPEAWTWEHRSEV
jgi:hypothetical protein